MSRSMMYFGITNLLEDLLRLDRRQVVVDVMDLVGRQDTLEGRHGGVLPPVPDDPVELVPAAVVVLQLRHRAAGAPAHAVGTVAARARRGEQRAPLVDRIARLGEDER